MRHRPNRDPSAPLIVDEGAPVAPAHCRPTRWNVRNMRTLAVVLVLLAVALSLLSTVLAYRTAVASSREAAQVDRRLSALEDYVNGKGAQRDAENQRLNQRITDTVCAVLDQLPAGGRLDTVRASYGCGPGVPAPGVVDRTTPRATAATAAAPSTAPVSAPRARTTTPAQPGTPATTPPAATSAPAPPSDPGGPLCVLLRLLCPSH